MNRLTSLLLVEERLLEAEHFALLLQSKYPPEIQFYLNAFLSAARSVTFLIQKELAHTPTFPVFWEQIQSELREDKAARFFLELRNFSQKAGRIAIQGMGGVAKPSGYHHPEILNEEPFMVYTFVSRQIEVPEEIKGQEITTACLMHIAKLAKLVLRAMDEFPFDTCPSKACTTAGAKHWDLALNDFLQMLGFPKGWGEAAQCLPKEEIFALVASQFDAVDRQTIERISDYPNSLNSTRKVNP